MKLDPTFSLWAFIFTHFHRFSIPFIVCTFGLGEQTYLIMVVWDHSDPRWTVASPRPHARKTSGRKTSGRKTSGKNKNASEASKPKKQHPRQDNHHGPDPAKKVIEITQHSPLPVSEINPKAWEEVGPRHGLMEVLWGEKRSDGFRYWSMDKFEAWVARYWLELDERQKLCVNIIRALIQNPSQWPDPKKKGQGLERHHLIPVSRGGNKAFPTRNDPTWCISLTYGHHLIMHICLATIHTHQCNESLLLSVGFMSWGAGGIDLERIITDAGADQTIAQQYTEFRNTRPPMTQETKDKISATLKGRQKGPSSEDHKAAISAGLRGWVKSEEHIQKNAIAQSDFDETQRYELVKLVLMFQFQYGRYFYKQLFDSQEFKMAIPIDLQDSTKIKKRMLKMRNCNQTLWNKCVKEAAASFSEPKLAEFALSKLVNVPAEKTARPCKSDSKVAKNASSPSKVAKNASSASKDYDSDTENESDFGFDLLETDNEDDFDSDTDEDKKLPARVSVEISHPLADMTNSPPRKRPSGHSSVHISEEQLKANPSKRPRHSLSQPSYVEKDEDDIPYQPCA